MQGSIGPTRVAKKIAPDQPGALRWARKYGAALVCVRYRIEATGRRRFTTVELLVDEAPRAARVDKTAPVALRIGYDETALRQLVKNAGARWDREARVWLLPLRQATKLGLLERLVPK